MCLFCAIVSRSSIYSMLMWFLRIFPLQWKAQIYGLCFKLGVANLSTKLLSDDHSAKFKIQFIHTAYWREITPSDTLHGNTHTYITCQCSFDAFFTCDGKLRFYGLHFSLEHQFQILDKSDHTLISGNPYIKKSGPCCFLRYPDWLSSETLITEDWIFIA
jgi:hypothetical protein